MFLWEDESGEWHRQDASSTATSPFGVSDGDALREIFDAICSGRVERITLTRDGFREPKVIDGMVGLALRLENVA